MIKAVLFDLDGVLVDSEPFSMEASSRVLAEFNIVRTPEEEKMIFGRRTIDNYRTLVESRDLKVTPEDLVKKKVGIFKKLIKGKLKPLPGVLDLISKVKTRGFKTAVVSSSPLERVNASLEEVGLILEFDLILSGDCCRRGKPDPEPFLLAAERLGVKPEECVVVEDAEAGIMAGKAAGMKVVAVRSPNTFGQDLSRGDVIVNSMEKVNVGLLGGL